MSPCNFLRPLVPALLLLPLVLIAGCEAPWPPDENPYTTVHPATDFGDAIQELYALITWWTLAIAAIVFLLLAYTIVRYKHDGSPGNPPQIHGNPQLEFAWTLLPVLIVVSIAVPTIRTVFALADAAPEDALEVRVIGKRWWWEFQYLDSGLVTATDMVIPAGRPISLLLESDNIIHSFWAPRLGGKRDLIPGRINRIWFTVHEEPPMTYRGECAEFCGEGHAHMKFRVHTRTPEGFEAWVDAMQNPQPIPDEVRAPGEQAFTAAGCAGCHSITDNEDAIGRRGPDLTGFAHREILASGAAPLTEENLAQWLRDPDSIKQGTTAEANPSRHHDGMNIPELSEEQISVLVDYLMALRVE